MAGCEIKRQHGIREFVKHTELRWICPTCLDVLERPENATTVEVIEVERKRQVGPFVMPLAGLGFILAVISEVLYYWH